MTASAPAPPGGILSTAFVLVLVANFVNALGQMMSSAILPLHVLAIGGSQADAGLVTGSMAFVALVLRPFVGWLVDAWRRRPMVLIGTAGYALSNVVYALSSTIPMLLFGRLIHGYGLSNYTTASSAFLADITPPHRRAEAMGLFAMAMDIGLVVGPAVAFMLIPLTGMRNVFYLTACLAGVAFVISLFPHEHRPAPSQRPPWTLRTGLIAVEAVPGAWMAFCLGMGFGPLMTFIAIFAKERGIANPGLYFTAQAAALMLSRTFSGRLADRRGRAFVVIPGLVCTAVSLALLPFAHDLPHFVLSAALFGLGIGSAQPATMALVVDAAPPERRGQAVSTYFLGFDSGISLGAIALGAVSHNLGFTALWTVSAGCVLLGLPALLAVKGGAPAR